MPIFSYQKLEKNLQKLIKLRIFKVVIFILVLYVTFVTRAHNYEKVPSANHLDEMLYAWSGIYLIETGVPISWSTLDYPKRAEVYKGEISYHGGLPKTSVTLYKPWLDEPPLFSLLVGFFAHLFGADRTQFVPSSFIRFPVIFISTLTSVFVFLVARKLSGFWVGVLAMLVYGSVPVIVIGSRTAMPENVIALFFTVTLYLMIKFQENQRFRYVFAIPFLAGVAGLCKPTGYFITPFALFLSCLPLLKAKLVKKAFLVSSYLILLTIPFVVAYFVYGYYFDKEIFSIITGIQSHRPVGFGSLAWYFITPSYDIVVLRDSWYVFCLLAAAFFIFRPKENLKWLVSLAFVYWVAVVMISGGENDLLSWYRFPTFPMLAILGTWGLEYILRRTDFFTTFLVAGLLLGNRMLLVNAFRPNIEPMSYRLVLTGLMTPSLLRLIWNRRWLDWLVKAVVVGVIAVGFYTNIFYIFNAFEISCQSKTCPIVPSTSLSTLHFPLVWRFFVLGESELK